MLNVNGSLVGCELKDDSKPYSYQEYAVLAL